MSAGTVGKARGRSSGAEMVAAIGAVAIVFMLVVPLPRNSGLSWPMAWMPALVSTKARHRGLAGFIVDGLIRDLPAIRALGDFPVYARGVTPTGPLHRGPGEINYPVCAGGLVVEPGDIIVGDAIGVVVIPQEIAADLLSRLQASASRESDYASAVARGDFSNDWVDALLDESGIELDGRSAEGSKAGS